MLLFFFLKNISTIKKSQLYFPQNNYLINNDVPFSSTDHNNLICDKKLFPILSHSVYKQFESPTTFPANFQNYSLSRPPSITNANIVDSLICSADRQKFDRQTVAVVSDADNENDKKSIWKGICLRSGSDSRVHNYFPTFYNQTSLIR